MFRRAWPVTKKNTTDNDELICLSVRTGLHLALSAIELPPQSEVLVTDINIPHMLSILEAHQLKAVPLSVNKHTLGISAGQLEASITSRTKVILITHLFGGIMDTDEIVAIAKKHNLIVIEDCAQAYIGHAYNGNPGTDVVMYSFGLIKTQTTLTGALLKFNNSNISKKAIALNKALPIQPTNIYLKKSWKGLFIKLLTTQVIYTLLYKFCIAKGRDFEELLSGLPGAFPARQ